MVDKATPLDLGAHFDPGELQPWMARLVRDLELDSIEEAAWGPPGGPNMLPVYRGESGRVVHTQPGWTPVELVCDAGHAAPDGLHLPVPGPQVDETPDALLAGTLGDGASLGEPGEVIDLWPWDVRGATPALLAAASFGLLTDRLAKSGQGTAAVRVMLPLGTSLPTSVALVRAVRIGCTRVLDAFGAERTLRILAISAPSAVYAEDPYTNLLRTTTIALSAALGGADEIGLLPYDYHAGGSPRSARLARNIHHLLRHEGLLGAVADPLAGAHYIEAFTRDLGTMAWNRFESWEAQGGLAAVLQTGALAAELREMRSARQAALAKGTRTIVGVNAFQEETT